MTVFLVSMIVVCLIASNAVLAYLLTTQTRDWREERAHLLHATMSRSLPELQASSRPAEPRPYVMFEDEELPVGL